MGVSLFALAPMASAQDAGVSEEQARCFVSDCDQTAAADPGANAAANAAPDDDCMVTGVCPVGQTRGFHLQTGPAAKASPPARAPRAPAPTTRTSTTRYTSSSRSSAPVASSVGSMKMPASRQSLDMHLDFELGSAQLTPKAMAQADIFARALKDAPSGRQFVIEGHTDSIGSAAYNMQLSRDRANSVVSYLEGKGVPSSKLRAVGYGFEHPLSGTTAADPSNRRVEIVKY